MKYRLVVLIFLTAVSPLFAQSPQPFLGYWSFDIEGGAVGWLNVSDEKGYLDADLLWKGGSVLPVANVYLEDSDTLVVTRIRRVTRSEEEERSHQVTSLFKFDVTGNRISGEAIEPKGNGMGITVTKIEGFKLPDVGPKPDLDKLKFGKKISIFNGLNLDGWILTDPSRVNGFKVVDGVLVNEAVQPDSDTKIRYGNIRTQDTFEDFKLTLEVNIPEGNNSGIYLRGMYEIQVLDSYGEDLDSHHMGALYSRIAPVRAAEKPAGQWQTMELILCKRHINVVLNGVTIIENQPAYGPTGGALQSDVFAPGPIYLQGDHGTVSFRNLYLQPIVN